MQLSQYPQLRSKHLVVNRVEKRLLRKLHRNIDDAIDTAGLPLIGVVPEDEKVRLATNREVPGNFDRERRRRPSLYQHRRTAVRPPRAADAAVISALRGKN